MDGNTSPMEAKIMQAIKSGELSKEKIEGGLQALIDTEVHQTERPANMELVESCLTLLSRLNNPGEPYISNKEESLANAKEKLIRYTKRRVALRNSLRVAAAVIVLTIGGFGIDALIRHESLTARPTVDEQQYQIKGTVTEGALIQKGQADSSGQINVINGDGLEDAINVLGYHPDVPTWIPEGWAFLDYYASASQFASIFRLNYQQESEENLIKFSASRYKDVSSAQAAFEQSKNGEVYKWNNQTVYVAKNLENTVAVWLSDVTCYSLSGPLDDEEIRLIIESIKRSET